MSANMHHRMILMLQDEVPYSTSLREAFADLI